MARTTKFVPPAKSAKIVNQKYGKLFGALPVSLSNLSEYAMEKKKS